MKEPKSIDDRTKNPLNTDNPDLLSDMQNAAKVLESVTLLLKCFKDEDDLGNAPERRWYGLAIILQQVQDVLGEAIVTIDRCNLLLGKSERA